MFPVFRSVLAASFLGYGAVCASSDTLRTQLALWIRRLLDCLGKQQANNSLRRENC